MKHNNNNIFFVLCIENKDCDDLEKRKVYQVLPDDKAADEGYVRIVDESGEDFTFTPNLTLSLLSCHAKYKTHFGLQDSHRFRPTMACRWTGYILRFRGFTLHFLF